MGEIQAGFTEEVAFDRDTEEEKSVPGGGNHMNKSMEARNYEMCLGRLGKTFLLLACRAGSYKGSHHGECGMPGEGTWPLSCK